MQMHFGSLNMRDFMEAVRKSPNGVRLRDNTTGEEFTANAYTGPWRSRGEEHLPPFDQVKFELSPTARPALPKDRRQWTDDNMSSLIEHLRGATGISRLYATTEEGQERWAELNKTEPQYATASEADYIALQEAKEAAIEVPEIDLIG